MISVLVAVLAGAAGGVGATLALDPATGPAGPAGEMGERGARGPVGPAGPVGDTGSASDYTLDWEEVWQAIENDPSRLGDLIDSNGLAVVEEEDPLAESICSQMQLSGIGEISDIGYYGC